MNVANGFGHSERNGVYQCPDNELAVGSTLGGPKITAIVKANGSIEKVWSSDQGEKLFGTLILRHYDRVTGMHLAQERAGTFYIYPEHQEHHYVLANAVAVREDIFVLSGSPGEDGSVDPPGVYLVLEMRNDGPEPVAMVTYAFGLLRGDTENDVVAQYDHDLGTLIAWNRSRPELTRIFGSSRKPNSFETTLDHAKAVSDKCPGRLSGKTDATDDPLGVLEHRVSIKPGKSVRYSYLLSVGNGRDAALASYRSCPAADKALERTKQYYHDMLSHSVVMTPDASVNRGVLWAKANMVRVQLKSPTGWCFVNDPTRSNNSVGRDTAWFALGSDYMAPGFSRESLLAYVRLQEKSGMIVEYYDIRNSKTEDYGLNINDNTPLLILALWHHYNATGDIGFLHEIYPSAVKAARFLLSQRNQQGLVWCTASGTSDWGIVGWRNVIPNYRLSGATTELNSECYAALRTVSQMARVQNKHAESAEFAQEADALKRAINIHLFNPNNGLYYLNIDLNGNPRSDITSDLVFPIIFGVASNETAAAITSRLSSQDFWTPAGIRTAPRDAVNYTPTGGWGLLGGVWVGVSFWYAFAVAKHSPEFMAHALSASFENYSSDPRRNNTVPGQFSEWLHGETLVNQGMMLSPWFPPRYLWAAIEGMGGFDISDGTPSVSPRLPPDWKWMAIQNLPYRDRHLTWFAVRVEGDIRIYTNFTSPGDFTAYVTYEEDISDRIRATGDRAICVGLRQDQNLLVLVANTHDLTLSTSVRMRDQLNGSYRLRVYDSSLAEWVEHPELLSTDDLYRGVLIKLERKGFAILELRQDN